MFASQTCPKMVGRLPCTSATSSRGRSSEEGDVELWHGARHEELPVPAVRSCGSTARARSPSDFRCFAREELTQPTACVGGKLDENVLADRESFAPLVWCGRYRRKCHGRGVLCRHPRNVPHKCHDDDIENMEQSLAKEQSYVLPRGLSCAKHCVKVDTSSFCKTLY